VDFDAWEPVYETIRADFGYDRTADEAARDRLATMVGDTTTAAPPADGFDGRHVAIAAPGPSLAAERDLVLAADVVLAAGTAADRLDDAGVSLDWIVTDLDGHAERIPAFTRAGPTVAIHAHGDNRDLLETTVPACELSAVVPTTQVEPVGPVHNYGGFTDGDRAAFLADALGADRLTFPGWDLDDPDVGPEKRAKLRWAARLLAWLEVRRGERVAVLDGRRDRLDVAGLPGVD